MKSGAWEESQAPFLLPGQASASSKGTQNEDTVLQDDAFRTRDTNTVVPSGVIHEGEKLMNGIKLIGAALIVAGVLGLVYGGFSYTKDTTAVKVGPLELTVQEKENVNVPLWAGIGAILVGGVLVAMGGRKG
jgi:hypothetical protein